ncbi:hypothetical protein [Streptomyces sp. NPDC001833]|uniref:hypothetical protein n=1 Tax=Streptomyces sp. NPDC001833 TaxID=3154658 RepID=UPI003333516B
MRPGGRGRDVRVEAGPERPEPVAVGSRGGPVRVGVPARRVRAVARRDGRAAVTRGVGPAVALAAVEEHGTPEQRAIATRAVLAGGRLTLLLPEAPVGGSDLEGTAGYVEFAPAGPAPSGASLTARLVVRGAAEDSFLGAPEHGAQVLLDALRSGWPLFVSAGIGTADTVLREVVGAAGTAGARPLDSSLTRRAVTAAFLELLVVDCLVTTAVRALELAPAQATALSAVAGHLGPRLLREGAEGLVPVLGRHAHTAYGAFGAIRARLRGLAAPSRHGPGSLGVLTALPVRGEHHAAVLPEAVHAPDGPPAPPGVRPVTAPAAWFDPRLPAEGLSGPLGALVRLLAREASVVRAEFAGARASGSAPALRAAADRYALLHAAACCLGVARNAPPGFLADPAWLTAALARIARRLALPPAPVSRRWDDTVLQEALTRYRDGTTLDLYASPLSGAGRRP